MIQAFNVFTQRCLSLSLLQAFGVLRCTPLPIFWLSNPLFLGRCNTGSTKQRQNTKHHKQKHIFEPRELFGSDYFSGYLLLTIFHSLFLWNPQSSSNFFPWKLQGSSSSRASAGFFIFLLFTKPFPSFSFCFWGTSLCKLLFSLLSPCFAKYQLLHSDLVVAGPHLMWSHCLLQAFQLSFHFFFEFFQLLHISIIHWSLSFSG